MPTPPTETLPIHAHRARIMETIAESRVTVIQGDTGSGKSTQLPKFCLAMGRGAGGLIGHTQPRRVAARGVARRIAEELEQVRKEGAGKETVGYKVRFTDRTGPDTRIKLMTDGILLAEIQGDRYLKAYDTLIIDEVHERSLTLDFLLGYLKTLLPRRPDLKVILASATIDAERFSRHFDDAPIIWVEGRAFPVTVRYWPLADEEKESASGKAGGRGAAIPEAVADAVQRIIREFGTGGSPDSTPATPNEATPLPALPKDILVFLAGEQEIRESAEELGKRHLPDTEVLPLFGRLDMALQDRIFAPHAHRHIVLATNIAETSLTVPGIGFVIDAGTARMSRYSHRIKVQRLPVEPISQASANQRKGRCGRVAPGVCIRLYSAEDFEDRPAFTEPEIRRTNLATVILRMKALGLGELERFPFLDRPDRRYIADGLRLLRELGALDREDRLTKRGRALARLPVDPRIGRMILAGAEEGCLAEVLVIAGALSIPDPREFARDREYESRANARKAAMEARARFRDGRSDFTELLRIHAFYREGRRTLSSNQLQKRCRRVFLSYRRMREWQEVYQQLRLQAREMGLAIHNPQASYARIHRALLTGLLDHVGCSAQEKTPKHETHPAPPNKDRNKDRTKGRDKGRNREDAYLGARNTRFLIGRDSVLHATRPRWVMAAELVQTNRTYARNVAKIRPEWVERVGKDFIKTTWFDSHWDARRGEVMAHERLTLHGLTLIEGRKIPYASVNPQEAREIFIEAALVEMGIEGEEGDAPFLAHNRTLIAHLREMEMRARRPDAFVEPSALYGFYDARIPMDVTGNRSFDAWRRRAERANPKLLFLSPADLCDPAALAAVRRQFPDEALVRGLNLPLRYCFEPGENADDTPDGVTVTLLQNALHQLDPGPFQWLAPGLLEEKILALLRGLPKPLRRALPPIAEIARSCFVEIAPQFIRAVYPEVSLLEALGEAIRRLARVTLSPDVWREERLAPYLRMNFRVIDAKGRVLREGRDLEKIRRELAPGMERTLPRPGHDSADTGPDTDPNADPNTDPNADNFHRDGLTAWDFPDLPAQVSVMVRGTRLLGYPALVDKGDSVSLRLVDSLQKAEELGKSGICRLLMLAMPREMRYLAKNLPNLQGLCLMYASLEGQKTAPIRPCDELREDLVRAIVEQTFLDDKPPIRARAAFQAIQKEQGRQLMTVANTLCGLTGAILQARHAASALLAKLAGRAPERNLADIARQLDGLVFRGFLRATPPRQLPHLPRYLQAATRRLEKLENAPDKDRRKMEEIIPLQQAHAALVAANSGEMNPELERQRWLMEELRVSLFAQELGTGERVSAKRLRKQFGP